ncbi:M20/M25/M40 family metallo-hydrolase [Rhodococcus sp. 3Y1]
MDVFALRRRSRRRRRTLDSPPFEPSKRDGAIYGRGTADSKANVIGMIGALRVFDGKPPVTVKLVIEGQEEFGSPSSTTILRKPPNCLRPTQWSSPTSGAFDPDHRP